MRLIASFLICLFAACVGAQTVNPSYYQGLQWRMIGPFRGGRTVGAAGVPGQPNVFYVGVNNGGVWKTNDFGETWKPLFDGQPTGSVGAVAVAPSAPDTVYVGSGEGLQRPDLSTGDGIYKSTDGGTTWQHLGLRNAQQIASIIVDPADPNRLFVAALGHPYGANEERGVFRSTDGGATWQKVLYKDADTGAVALAFDPSNSQIVYADLWAARQAPWENGGWQGPGSGLYKSADGGNTWIQLGGGLPTLADGVGRIGISVSTNHPNRIFAMVDAKNGGLYRSEDAGATWTLINNEGRIWGRGSDFAEVRVDPKNENTVYVANTCTYKSTDGGKSFTAWKGAPGGDDYHTIWINPDNPQIVLLACDQGATLTVNGGETWSSWYNQPTAQFYHVATDNQFPYWVYGGQQESGSAMVCSRGNDGEITFRDWHPVGSEEYGYTAPDPLNPNIVYGGKATKFDKLTGQVQDVGPTGEGGVQYRFLRTAPLLFSPVDPHTLYLAGNVLFQTTDGAHSWQVISPDLTRKHPKVPDSVGVYRAQTPTVEQRGVIYAVGPSYMDANVIWAGSDDGLIHVTFDGGKSWSDVTPPGVSSWFKISQIDAGHFDKATAYVSVNCLRLDDLRPYIFRTHDGGKSWKEITRGLPDNAPVNTVREDPLVRGLLYCGTELAVYFSIDDGDTWNPLRQNMPATSIRDLVVHANDLVVATHGRSFWIMDDILPLRQMARLMESPAQPSNIPLESEPASPIASLQAQSDSKARPQNPLENLEVQSAAASGAASHHGSQTLTQSVLFKPETAYRYRRDTNSDTPLPPEVPAGQNPPDGAILDYFVPKSATTVVLEILDSENHLVRRYSSADKPDPVNPKDLDVPTYWIRPSRILATSPGEHRFVWDLYWQPNGFVPFYPISAVYKDTPPVPTSPIAMPGTYTVKLSVDGETHTQHFLLKLDPRITTPATGIRREFVLAKGCYDMAIKLQAAASKRGEQKAPRRRFGRGGQENSLSGLAQAFSSLMSGIDGADATPTSMMEDEYRLLMVVSSRALASTDH